MEKFLYPTHPLRCIVTAPSECGKSIVVTNLILNNIFEYDKLNIYPPNLHQDLYQKLIKHFSNYIPIHIKPNILNEEDIDIRIDEIVNDKDFQESDTEIEACESIEELKYPQECNSNQSILITLDDLKKKEKEDSRV